MPLGSGHFPWPFHATAITACMYVHTYIPCATSCGGTPGQQQACSMDGAASLFGLCIRYSAYRCTQRGVLCVWKKKRETPPRLCMKYVRTAVAWCRHPNLFVVSLLLLPLRYTRTVRRQDIASSLRSACVPSRGASPPELEFRTNRPSREYFWGRVCLSCTSTRERLLLNSAGEPA